MVIGEGKGTRVKVYVLDTRYRYSRNGIGTQGKVKVFWERYRSSDKGFDTL